jgi:N-acetylglucosamine kinase-like BadF-type ATPase
MTTPSPSYFLGVDGGQSSTTALIGDPTGRVLGYGRGGPCNHVGAAEGRAKFTSAIEASVSSARAQAGLDNVRFACACLGFSGGPDDKEAILQEILPADKIVVTHDAIIALSGATAGAPGIVIIAGTGSMAFGRNAAGKTARAGGWGYIYGDEGGGFDLTRQALRAALKYEEGWGEATILREKLLAATDARDANHLLHLFYTAEFPRPRIAALSTLVEQAAEEGDAVAARILTGAADHLKQFADAVRLQLFDANDKPLVVPIGGVFRGKLLAAGFAPMKLSPPIYGPAAGALLEAYRIAGIACPLSNVPEFEK